jgi:sphingolipid delta-4 desaturase
MANKHDFTWSSEANIHKRRAKVILNQHPEIRNLIGRNPLTFVILLFCVALQIATAVLFQHASWLLVFVVSYSIGAFASHCLFIIIHECTHNLLFKNKTLNILAGILANLPLVFPSSVSFQRYHLQHHSHMGVTELDADMPFDWEARLINNSWYGKALWLLFFPVFQLLRPFRLKMDLFDNWTIVNWIIQSAFMVAVVYLLGAKATCYLVFSFFFSVGLHPLGARWIQEHYLTHGDEQETKSYYGPLNTINMNVGYHNEHHDFPSVPWNNLPKVKQLAHNHYSVLGYHTSYTGLLFRFLFDKDLSLYSRTKRAQKLPENKQVA